jgi:hypothetical protein
MAGEIRNKVAENTKLITFNLEDYYQEGKRLKLDISQWLDQGFILREKDFRDSLDNFNWEHYKGAYVAVYCSTDAIVPGWAYMLLIVKLNPFAKHAVIGGLEVLETAIYTQVLDKVAISNYKDKFGIIKGCANKPVPQSAYLIITNKLVGIAKSIMYGEACSSVPLYKRK